MRHTTFALLLVPVACLIAQGTSRERAMPEGPSGRLTLAWSLKGRWTGVATDRNSGATWAIDPGGAAGEIDPVGRVRRELVLPKQSGSLLRIAHLSAGSSQPALLTFAVSSSELHAYRVDGSPLWTYPGTGVNDAWAVSIARNQPDQVVVGYNGGNGLHVLDHDGQLLWKTTAIGNVWHVASGDLWGGNAQQIVTTSATGLVHVFRNGTQRRIDLPVVRVPPAPSVPRTYASMVRVGKAVETDRAAEIFVVGERPFEGSGPRTEHLVALSLAGDREWTVDLPSRTSHVDSAALASGKPWLAIGLRGGRVYVVDVAEHRISASVDGQGLTPEVAWTGGGTPRLLIATGASVNAFNVVAAPANAR